MKRYCIIYVIIGLCFFSCTKEKVIPSVYDLKVINIKEILLEKSDKNEDFANKQVIEIDDANILIINVNGKKLSFYDIDNGQKIHEIVTDKEKVLESYYYINKDSIFIFYDSSHPPSSADREVPGQFQLIDYNGIVKTKFPYNIAPSDWVNKVGIKKLLPPSQYWDEIHIIGNNVFFKTLAQEIGNVGTKEFMENRFPLLMRYNIVDQKFYISELNSFPYIEEGIYYPTSWTVVYPSISGNKLPLIRYNYSSDVFEWDYINDMLITHSLKSRLIDTIKPMASPSTYHFNKLECAYAHIKYDSYRKLYFANLYYNEDFYDTKGGLRTLIIANEKFEYLGELYCNKQFPIHYTKNHTLSITNKNDSTLQIDYLKLVKTNRDYDLFIDSCKNDLRKRREKVIEMKKHFGNENNPVLEYLKTQRDIKGKDYSVITVYSMSGCGPCNELMLGFISSEQKLLGSVPFYLIITGENINAEIERFQLKDFKNLIIDSTGIVKKTTVYDGLLNPRLTIVKNGKVTDDAIYESSEIGTVLIPNFIGSYGFCFAK